MGLFETLSNAGIWMNIMVFADSFPVRDILEEKSI